jgi:DEAD/DEAH box helicase
MIFTITVSDKVVAFTNDKASLAIAKARYSNAEIRWSTPAEAAKFRELESRHNQRHWLSDKINAALIWIWHISFPPMRRGSRFREGQLPVVQAALIGRSLLVVSPTGFGKTLCFQLPAVLRRGVSVVISPLKALMGDVARPE